VDHPIVKKISRIVAAVVIGMFLVECDSPHYYQQLESTKDNWDKDAALNFTFEVKDTVATYDFYLLSRNNNQYPYSNLYLITELRMPEGEKYRDTLQYFLAYPDGKWIGQGNSLKELYLLYRENISFKDTGKYKLQVWHGMREDRLIGIEDLSLIVEKN